MSADVPVLEADAISKAFRGHRVLTTAFLRLYAGRVTGLLGRNGAGKSTLLSCLVGLRAPDSGYIRLNGVAHEQVRLHQLARQGVFFLPDRELLHPRLGVQRQLRAVAQRSGHVCDVDALYTQLRLTTLRDAPPHALSGGERRRAEVAFALLCAPRVLVLDEPLRGIAPLDAEIILQALRAFTRAGGAVLITGHELPSLLPALDAVCWCHAGRTREFDSTTAALADHAFRQHFLPWGATGT
jgi:lipopolysaccharide export system ATP-binding protein